MQKDNSTKFDTKVIHGSQGPSGLRDVVPPIHASTIFTHPESGMDTSRDHYTRAGNPNRRQLEQLCATLEDGAAAFAFSSGMAAVSAVLQSLEPGDHIMIPKDVYHGTRTLVHNIMQRWNLLFDEVDMTDLDEINNFIRPETRLIWLETPSNPMLHITDISAVVDLIRKKAQHIRVAVDNTWPSPALQKPLNLGADISMHSTTKYLGGHSDLLGGVVITREHNEISERILQVQQQIGAVPSPNDCWLLSRSIKTLAWRMKGHCQNAREIAGFLQSQENVTKVYYPGFEDHPGYQIANRQMSDYGGMISFEVDGGADRALKVVNKAKLITRATSLGGVESLWEHRLSSETEGSVTPPGLIRLSVGLEDVEDLKKDILQALR